MNIFGKYGSRLLHWSTSNGWHFWAMISFVLVRKFHLKKYFTRPHPFEPLSARNQKWINENTSDGHGFGCNHKSHILFMWIVLCPHFNAFCKADAIWVNNLYWILLAHSLYPTLRSLGTLISLQFIKSNPFKCFANSDSYVK